MKEKNHIADQILILRCQLGDEQAFERLVTQYAGRLKYYVRRLVGAGDGVIDATKADDILQDVWLAVWRQLPKLRSTTAFRVWLYRIARNTALQLVRKRVVEVPLDDRLPAPETPEESFGPEDAAAIHTALERLTEAHREVLALRFLEELPYEEIAEIVDCSIGTVRSRIYYAKRALRSEMETTNHE